MSNSEKLISQKVWLRLGRSALNEGTIEETDFVNVELRYLLNRETLSESVLATSD